VRAIVIPADDAQPIREVEIEPRGDDSCLAAVRALVGGDVEGLPCPVRTDVAVFIHGEGKFTPTCLPNKRATTFMAPVLRARDWIAGDLVLTGVAPRTGETVPLPDDFAHGLFGDAS
jgi:hypothetical protein